jgi:hypothetical protein
MVAIAMDLKLTTSVPVASLRRMNVRQYRRDAKLLADLKSEFEDEA